MKCTVDKTTGEMWTDECLLFLALDPEVLEWIYGAKSITTVKVLFYFLLTADLDNDEIHLTTHKRNALCERLHISDAMLGKAIKSLMENGFIHGGKGEYTINNKLIRRDITE